MLRRGERHELIKRVVRDEPIKTQRALAASLKARGYDITQATVSRDVTDLGICKSPNGLLVLPGDLHLRRMVHDLSVGVARSDKLVIIKTSTGTASGVAAALDATEMPGVLGTIAGDDTILAICEDEASAKALEERISALAGEPDDKE